MSHATPSRPGDYFSAQSAEYARYRPHYPPALFEYLASIAPARDLAWDCATGNGQAAIPLAAHFKRVIATDISASQLSRATRHARVQYAVASASASGLPDRSADLVSVAQALHWFDLDAFYLEVNRVLRPAGVLAVSSYDSARIDDPALNGIYSAFEWDKLGSFWPPRRRLVGEALRTLDFPFEELTPPSVTLEARWTLDELLGYVRSWSATARYVGEIGEDPTPELRAQLEPGWGPPESRRLIIWPFILRIGRVPIRATETQS